MNVDGIYKIEKDLLLIVYVNQDFIMMLLNNLVLNVFYLVLLVLLKMHVFKFMIVIRKHQDIILLGQNVKLVNILVLLVVVQPPVIPVVTYLI
jgi:hypothetical protein